MKKKKINKKDIPGYAYGASEVAGAVTNGLASVMPYATSGLATVGTALGGMASGAAAGAALGPWGAAIGGAIGLLGGSIGSGGSVDEMTGEITNPSGIAGLFGHSKGYLQRKSNRIRNSNLGRQMTDALRADYYNNSMAEYNPNTFAEGGIVPTTLGWVDDGEFGRNADGTLFKVPDEGKPTDSNLMLLEVGSQLWSPNLKNPHTKNTFAVDAENIAKKYKTNGTDKYAKTTKSLNDAQMHKELDDLLTVQESVKMKKNKTKGDLPAYEDGKNGEEDLSFWDNQRKRKSILGKWLLDYDAGQEQRRQNTINWFKDFVSNGGEYRFNKGGGLEIKSNGKWYRTKDGSFTEKDRAGAMSYSYPGVITPEIAYMFDKSKHNYGINIPERSAVTIDSNILSDIDSAINSYDPVKFYGNEKSEKGAALSETPDGKKKIKKSNKSTNAANVSSIPTKIGDKVVSNKSVNVNNVSKVSTPSKLTPLTKEQLDAHSAWDAQVAKGITNSTTTGYKSGWLKFADTLPQIAQFAAPIINLAKSKEKAEQVDPVLVQPYFGRTTVDARPALNEITKNRSIANYNMSQMGSGAWMPLATETAINTNRSIADLYSDIYNKEIGLSHSNAGIMNQVLQHNANARRIANDLYSQNLAAKDNLGATAISQIGKGFGKMSQDNIGNRHNAAVIYALSPQMRKGMIDADVNRLFNILGYGN